MGTCVSVRKTPEYVSQAPIRADDARTAADWRMEELNLGSAELAPGSPTPGTRGSHVELIVLEVSGIPRRNKTLDKLSSKSGYFCEVWYVSAGANALIYRTVTRFPAENEKTTSIVFNPKESNTDRYGDNVVRVPRTEPNTDTQAPPVIMIQIFASYFETSISEGVSRLVGETRFPVSELEKKDSWQLWMFDPQTDLLVFDRSRNAAPMSVSISVPSGQARTEEIKPTKRCAVITRGTRGDVQPYVALARGLAETMNWDVTIITEMRYRDLVIKNSVVKQGAIHFRPSGGDTEARIDRPMARWFIMQENHAFQMLMLARAEREFFESEPAFSYFVKESRPDYLLFGFNTANLALILSESFRLPICGFILQPTIIPSSEYPAIVPVGSADESEKTLTLSLFQELRKNRRFSFTALTTPSSESRKSTIGDGESKSSDPTKDSTAGEPSPTSPSTDSADAPTKLTVNSSSSPEKPTARHALPVGVTGSGGSQHDDAVLWTRCDIPLQQSPDPTHSVLKVLKPLMENNIFTSRINTMRQAHGLPRQKGEDIDFKILQNLDVPMVCPINEKAFGGRPKDWKACISFSDFIFLSPVSNEEQPIKKLTPALQKFILDARDAGAPIVAIGFSSMPVSRTAILGLSSLVAERSARGARVIALVGVRPGNEVTDQLEETRAAMLKGSGKLLEIGAAPFGILFPFCDFLIVHGGLGTTGEALRAGKPCLITGVLVLDQRFWGHRIHKMGCGPKPIHIRNLRSEIVKIVDKGLTPGNPWSESAMKMASALKESGHGDGIALNVQCVAAACEQAAKKFEQLPKWKSSRSVYTTADAPSVADEIEDDVTNTASPSPDMGESPAAEDPSAEADLAAKPPLAAIKTN